jgi:hypothetical protein
MIEILPMELPTRPLVMQPLSVVRDGTADPSPEPDPATALSGRLRLGGPVSVPISAAFAADDPALRAFIEHEAKTYSYHLVHVALTAVSEPGQDRFERLGIVLNLTSVLNPAAAEGTEGAVPEAKPIAWSMAPMRVTDTSQLTTTLHLGPQLKLFGVEAELGSVERSRTSSDAQVYLEALNELREDPGWELHRTRSMAIRGSHRLALVLRLPADASTRMDATVYATLARGARPWRERAELKDVLPLSTIG